MNYGFIETPYRKVIKSLPIDSDELIGRTLRDDIEDAKENVILEEGTILTEEGIAKLAKAKIKDVPVVPFVTDEIEYLNADRF
jgi:DNA-directed RNA polymerase subunit beta